MAWSKIAKCLNVSERTVYRRVKEFKLNRTFCNKTDEELDEVLKYILSTTPGAGEKYVCGGLKSRGLNVQRWKVRERLRIIDPIARAVRVRHTIKRRVYSVPAPNCYGIDYETLVAESSESSIVIPECLFHLNENEISQLERKIDPLRDDSDFGIHHFCTARSMIMSMLSDGIN